MVEVISIKFKNRGKAYFFDPNGLDVKTGQKVIVETAKGLDIADCVYGNHAVMDTSVVQPLRPVVRIATEDDLRIEEINKKREKEAFEICQEKISQHELDMKLVDVECNFEGNKITFFFTSDGRVDFRELVKDLAGIFRNRIELRQIGVRDEAKMIGGIGICGRPYCCHQFLDEFQPVSTKMAKVQSLSLNPTKISGSCGRLMCCLRYEQEAYEELLKKVPKQGAFVQTKDGYGTAVQVNLLRQTVKVKLDEDTDDTLRLYKANELAAVPGGRPKDGEEPPDVFTYVPEVEEEEEEPENPWLIPMLAEDTVSEETVSEENEKSDEQGRKRNNRRRRENRRGKGRDEKPANQEKAKEPEKPERQNKPQRKPEPEKKAENDKKPEGGKKNDNRSKPRPNNKNGKATVKPVKVEAKPQSENKGGEKQAEKPAKDGNAHRNNRRRYHRPRGKSNGGENKQ